MDIENNNNYKYYKLIFSNIYLKNLIYEFVCKDIYLPNSRYKVFKYKYKDIDLNFITKTKNYKLLKDKLKSNSPIKNINISRIKNFNTLVPFIINLKNDLLKCGLDEKNKKKVDKLLLKFYNVNKLQDLQQQLINPVSIIERRYCFENPIDLIECFLDSNCTVLLKQLYKDYNNIVGIKKCKFSLIDSPSPKETLRVYERALSGEDIEMVDFIFKEIKLQLSHKNNNDDDGGDNTTLKEEYWNDFKNSALHWAIRSPNRDEMVPYLLNEMKFIVPKDYIGTFDGYFDNLLKLDHKLLKCLIDYGAPLLNVDYPVNIEYATPLSLKYIQPKKLIDFVQNSILASIVQRKIKDPLIGFENYFENILKKIDLILEYNNRISIDSGGVDCTNGSNGSIIPDQNNLQEIKKIKERIIGIENLHQNKANLIYKINQSQRNSAIPSFFKLFFKSNETVQSTTNTISKFLKPSVVSFESPFNLEREIKRTYLFDFVFPLLLSKGTCSIRKRDIFDDNFLIIKTLSVFIINFARQFNDFEMILDFKNSGCLIQSYGDSFVSINNTSRNLTILSDTCQEIATQNADKELVLFLFNNFKDESTGTICFSFQNNVDGKQQPLNNKLLLAYQTIPIENQIQYFLILLKYNINYPVSISDIFKNILIVSNSTKKHEQSNEYTISFQKLDEIANKIENYYNDHFDDGTFKTGKSYLKKFSSSILKENRYIGDYFYLKHNNLFHNWREYYS